MSYQQLCDTPPAISEAMSYSIPSHSEDIVAIIGAPGAGKSSFVNMATGTTEATIGHTLSSCTQEIQVYSCHHPDDNSRKVIFVDTPGFDDTNFTDIDILQTIADWLKKTYGHGATLAGLLLLHSITDNRIGGMLLKNLAMLKRLCGTGMLQNVMLVTTMWDEIDEPTGSSYERELQAKYWKTMINAGSRMARFCYTHQSAWSILNELTSIRCPLQTMTAKEKKVSPQAVAHARVLEYGASRLEYEPRLRGTSKHYNSNATMAAIAARGWLNEERKQNKKADSRLTKHRSFPALTQQVESWSSLPGMGWSTISGDHRTESSSPNTHRRILAATIAALRHAQQVARMSLVPGLGGAVGLSLTIAESVESMERNEQAFMTLAQSAGQLIVAVTEQVSMGEVSDDINHIVNELFEDLKAVQAVVKDATRHGRVSRYMLHAADAQLVSACNERIHAACRLFEMRSTISTRQAIARMEALMAAYLASQTTVSVPSTH